MKTLRRLLLAMVVLAASTAMVWAQNAHKSRHRRFSARFDDLYTWAGATSSECHDQSLLLLPHHTQDRGLALLLQRRVIYFGTTLFPE